MGDFQVSNRTFSVNEDAESYQTPAPSQSQPQESDHFTNQPAGKIEQSNVSWNKMFSSAKQTAGDPNDLARQIRERMSAAISMYNQLHSASDSIPYGDDYSDQREELVERMSAEVDVVHQALADYILMIGNVNPSELREGARVLRDLFLDERGIHSAQQGAEDAYLSIIPRLEPGMVLEEARALRLNLSRRNSFTEFRAIDYYSKIIQYLNPDGALAEARAIRPYLADENLYFAEDANSSYIALISMVNSPGALLEEARVFRAYLADTETFRRYRSAYLEVIKHLDPAGALEEAEALRSYLTNPDEDIRRNAVQVYESLAHALDPAAALKELEALRPYLTNPDEGIRLTAVEAYGLLSEGVDPEEALEAAHTLIDLFADDNAGIRSVAIQKYADIIARLYTDGSINVFEEIRPFMIVIRHGDDATASVAYSVLRSMVRQFPESPEFQEVGRALLRERINDRDGGRREAAIAEYVSIMQNLSSAEALKEAKSLRAYPVGEHDLNLYLYRWLISRFDCSAGMQEIRSLTISTESDYYIEVAKFFAPETVTEEIRRFRENFSDTDESYNAGAAKAYGYLITRVDTDEVLAEAAALRQLFGDASAVRGSGAALAYRWLAGSLDPSNAYKEAKELRRLFRDANAQIGKNAAAAYAAVAERLDPAAAFEEAKELRRLFKDSNEQIRESAVSAYTAVARRFDPAAASEETSALRELFEDAHNRAYLRLSAIRVYVAASTNLETAALFDTAMALRKFFGDDNDQIRKNAILSYCGMVPRVGPGKAYEAGDILRNFFSEADEGIRSRAILTYFVLARRFGGANASEAAPVVRRFISNADSYISRQAVWTYEALASEVDSAAAFEEAKALRELMEGPDEQIRAHAIDAYPKFIRNMDATAAVEEVKVLRQYLASEDSQIREFALNACTFFAYQSLHGRHEYSPELKAEITEGAKTLRDVMVNGNNDELRLWATQSYHSLGEYVDSNERLEGVKAFRSLFGDANEQISNAAIDEYSFLSQKLDLIDMQKEASALSEIILNGSDSETRLHAIKAATLLVRDDNVFITDEGDQRTYYNNTASVLIPALRELFAEVDQDIRSSAIEAYRVIAERLDPTVAQEEAAIMRTLFSDPNWLLYQAATLVYRSVTDKSAASETDAIEGARILRGIFVNEDVIGYMRGSALCAYASVQSYFARDDDEQEADILQELQDEHIKHASLALMALQIGSFDYLEEICWRYDIR